ncbi:MAG TPA: hypothetical protein VMR81_08030 [Patescibacteria group bacterium]|nr:hypothetical protein [Patescibacteria group bacterium]
MPCTEIVIATEKLSDKFDPNDPCTLKMEEKLLSLNIFGGRIQGVKPIENRAGGTLPPNSGHKTIEGHDLIIAPEGSHTIVVLGEVGKK